MNALDAADSKQPAGPEPWITEQRPAEHLSATPRSIDVQQRLGLPCMRTPGLNRYRISEVEAWLRQEYGAASLLEPFSMALYREPLQNDLSKRDRGKPSEYRGDHFKPQ